MTKDNDLVKRLRAVDHLSVEDCFLQSPLYAYAADRIEALEAKLATCEKYKTAYAECDRIGTQAVRDLEAKLAEAEQAGYANAMEAERKLHEGRIEELEAKLAKALEALRDAVDAWDNHNKTGDMMQGHWVTDARTTLAELKGDKP